jgi:hypothetical protein
MAVHYLADHPERQPSSRPWCWTVCPPVIVTSDSSP